MFAHQVAKDLFAARLGHRMVCAIPLPNPVTDDVHQTREWMRAIITGYLKDLVNGLNQGVVILFIFWPTQRTRKEIRTLVSTGIQPNIIETNKVPG